MKLAGTRTFARPPVSSDLRAYSVSHHLKPVAYKMIVPASLQILLGLARITLQESQVPVWICRPQVGRPARFMRNAQTKPSARCRSGVLEIQKARMLPNET